MTSFDTCSHLAKALACGLPEPRRGDTSIGSRFLLRRDAGQSGVSEHETDKNLARIQSTIADAEMMLVRRAPTSSHHLIVNGNAWKKPRSQPKGNAADVWVARVNVCHAARQAIRMLFDALGGAAIYTQKGPLDRALRDADTWCQHLVGQHRTLEWVGALLVNSDERPNPML
jgi:alkylation response protein AidB-like acyl-CoA dehydrogenase